jgi:hypothetical protein
MTTHISNTRDSIPNINQMDHYAVAMSNIIRFDSDSLPIKIDNCCTQTISGYREDFIPTTLKQVEHLHVNGFGNTRTAITHKGTVKWVVIDDSGQHQDILIPNTYYVPNCGTRLLSPQHWAQEVQDNFPTQDGTWCATFNDRVILEWNQRKYTKTIQINPDKSNVAIMWTIDGTKRYNKFASMIHKYAMDTTIWEDNNDEETNSAISPGVKNTVDDDNEGAWDIIHKVSRDDDSTLQIMGEDTQIPHNMHTNSLLEWHIRLGHMSFKRIQSLAKIGKLPKILAKCKIPLCAGCFYGKLTRQPWRHKGEHKHIADNVEHPGDCVSVDQMYSSIPGLVGQLKGIPTRNRY